MKKLVGNMPLLAFTVAAFAAVAFTSPNESATMYGFDGTHWYLVDENTPPGSYSCESDSEPGCLFDSIEGEPVNTELDRKFVNISLTPIED
ncbi:hypothetical protein [Algoriphagus sp.]|uniref:hypothetical protein n=1 Tax=Algoriphagus sp. TaxID=1872435 RepID=UPI003F713B2B